MLNYCISPDAPYAVNTKCKYDSILVFWKRKIYSFVSFENWFRPLKFPCVLHCCTQHAFALVLQLPKLSCMRLLPIESIANNLFNENGVLFAFVAAEINSIGHKLQWTYWCRWFHFTILHLWQYVNSVDQIKTCNDLVRCVYAHAQM